MSIPSAVHAVHAAAAPSTPQLRARALRQHMGIFVRRRELLKARIQARQAERLAASFDQQELGAVEWALSVLQALRFRQSVEIFRGAAR